jgi:hypothetical protein
LCVLSDRLIIPKQVPPITLAQAICFLSDSEQLLQ